MRTPVSTDGDAGRLHARPGTPKRPPIGRGTHRISTGRDDALLFVPNTERPGPMPLIAFYHGAGGVADQAVRYLGNDAQQAGCLLLGIKSAGPTWDGIRGDFGADVDATDLALREIFDRFTVDPMRLAIAGFSDGATYALSLGLMNGDLFSDIVAFSPGFIIPSDQDPVGAPRIFISHGTRDTVLGIDQTSRRIVPRLERAGYDLDYHEFDGGHAVVPALASATVKRVISR